jgi:drug/metabolite transporter (DMT)-like permease
MPRTRYRYVQPARGVRCSWAATSRRHPGRTGPRPHGTATYPVLGAILARLLLRQRLDRVGWIRMTVTAAGATLIALDAGGSDDGIRTLVGIAVALGAAAAVALEGIVATHAMVGLDTPWSALTRTS